MLTLTRLSDSNIYSKYIAYICEFNVSYGRSQCLPMWHVCANNQTNQSQSNKQRKKKIIKHSYYIRQPFAMIELSDQNIYEYMNIIDIHWA